MFKSFVKLISTLIQVASGILLVFALINLFKKSSAYKEVVDDIDATIEEVLEKVEDRVEAIEKEVKPQKQIKKIVKEIVANPKLNKRQAELLEFFENNGDSNMTEIYKKFSEVSQRTIRRDLGRLEDLGVVKQSGKTKNSIYKFLKNS